MLHSKTAMQGKISSSIVSALFLILFLSAITRVNAESKPTKGYSLDIKTYSIQIIPFKRYEIPAKQNMPAIVFAEYSSEAKVVYPAHKDKIPANATDIVKKCQTALEDNIDRVINAQQENGAVRSYLSADNKIALFKKEDYIYLINNPREQTVQIEPATNNILAEFRSKEIAINENSSFCLYITFIPTLQNRPACGGADEVGSDASIGTGRDSAPKGRGDREPRASAQGGSIYSKDKNAVNPVRNSLPQSEISNGVNKIIISAIRLIREN